MRRAFWAYFVVLHLLFLLVVFSTDIIDRVARRLGLTNLPPFDFYWNEMMAAQKRQDEQLPAGTVLFVGDETVLGLDVGQFGRRAANFGISYDTTGGVQRRLPLYKSLNPAGGVVLLVGMNDLRYPGDIVNLRDAMTVAGDYRNVLYRVPSDVTVVALSVLPVDEVVTLNQGEVITNSEVARLNEEIRNSCSARPKCRYADAWPALTQGGSGLYPKYHGEGDGLHLNGEGYRQLAKVIKAALDAVPGG